MKKWISVFFLVSIITTAQSQYDPEALAVLEAMSTKYKQVKAFKATFSQELVNENADINESISGEITVKGNKYLLRIAGQEIYNNATDVYSYSEELGEVTISTYEPEDSEITLGNIYDLYQSGFKYNLLSINQAGDRIIEMDPESKDKSYFKIRLVIDKMDNLKKFTVFERSGNKYIYSINSFNKLTNLEDNFFTFNVSAYPDVEVIDFR